MTRHARSRPALERLVDPTTVQVDEASTGLRRLGAFLKRSVLGMAQKPIVRRYGWSCARDATPDHPNRSSVTWTDEAAASRAAHGHARSHKCGGHNVRAVPIQEVEAT